MTAPSLAAKGEHIWLVSDGNPGHYNQSLAMAEALGRAGFGPISWVETRKFVRGFFRPFAATLLNSTRGSLPRAVENWMGPIEGKLPEAKPQIILSSGGKTAYLNVLLARRYRVPNVFIGLPPDLATHHFSAIMHTEENWHPANGMEMDFLPTRLAPNVAAKRGQEFRAEMKFGDRRLCAMLIGGNSRSHTFKSGDWRALAEGMNHLAATYKFGWLVTSSRRTGAEAEATLRSTLDPAHVADATWWGAAPKPIVVAYLSASDAVFCTQDSMTMLSEGITCGKPVYALYPDEIREDALEGNFNARFLQRNVKAQRIRRVHIARTKDVEMDKDIATYFHVVTEDVMKDTTRRLLEILNRA